MGKIQYKWLLLHSLQHKFYGPMGKMFLRYALPKWVYQYTSQPQGKWSSLHFLMASQCKNHTSAIILLDKGAVLDISKKQKINTKSSTEAVLVGIDDEMHNMIWTSLFLSAKNMHCISQYFIRTIGVPFNLRSMVSSPHDSEPDIQISEFLFIKDHVEQSGSKSNTAPQRR